MPRKVSDQAEPTTRRSRSIRSQRTIRADNYTPVPPDKPAMEIIQGGINLERRREAFAPSRSTGPCVTGLKHVVGTVSMARAAAADTARSDVFICLDDQPSLDFGGKRFDDGQGAPRSPAYVKGLDVVRKIQQQPTNDKGAADASNAPDAPARKCRVIFRLIGASSMKRTLIAVLAVLVLVAGVEPRADVAPAAKATPHVPTMEQFMSFAFPMELVAAKKADRIAWISERQGAAQRLHGRGARLPRGARHRPS